MDGMKKGTVRVAGHGTYEIDVTFSLLHEENCTTCETMSRRCTGIQYNGPIELGQAVETITTHYAYAIRYDDTYIHARRIGVEVFEIRREGRECIAQYEITPEASKL